MDPTSPFYVGFNGDTSRWSPNLTSTAWVIYSPSHEFIHIDGICVGIATNNQDECDSVIGLLTTSLHLGICRLDVFLDSQLLVSQLNNYYWLHDPCLFIKFLHTIHLVRHLESISFIYVPISINIIADQMDNDVLEWHINHCI